MRPKLNLQALHDMPEGPDKEEAKRLIAELDAVAEANPLAFFEPHPKQAPFFEAKTSVVAAFCGNRWGKTTALTTRILIECLDEDWLPEHLRPYKRWSKNDTAPRGTFVRIVNPSFKLLESVILPAFRQWAPAGALKGGGFDKAYKGPPDRKLTFANGSWIEFLTYEVEVDKFGGTALHVVAYDEPPPQDIREECKYRLSDYRGYELFACTPLKVNIGHLRRDIWRQRESPKITVVRGSIHDNPFIDEEGKQDALETGDPRLRQAREYGDFTDVGGLIYPGFETCVIDRPSVEVVRTWDHVCGIDPGIRNAGIVFIGFDDENVATQFDEGLLQDSTPEDYAAHIKATYEKWGVPLDEVQFVIDPAARARSQVNAETVQTALAREDIFCVEGQNDVEAGISQMLTRINKGRWRISRECRLTRDQADEYAAEDRGDGEFKPIKANDHLLDAARYVVMTRPFIPLEEERAPRRMLGFEPGVAPALDDLDPVAPVGALGAMS